MKLSFSGVWDDTVRRLRADASLFVAVAGAFLFFPTLVLNFVAPQPTGGAEGVTFAQIAAYAEANWELILLANLIGFIGNIAVLVLALDERRPTVGGAIAASLRLLPAYFLAMLLMVLIVSAGLAALVLPGLYLLARMTAMGPVIVAEDRHNPFQVLRRSFAVTKGHGWAILGLLIIIFVTFWIISMAATVVFGSVFLLLDRTAGAGGVGSLLLILLQAAIAAGFSTVLVVLLASLYRRLTSAPMSGS